MLQKGEPAKAVSLLDAAPKAYFKDSRFPQTYSRCREALDRVTSIRQTTEQVEKNLATGKWSEAEQLLHAALGAYPSDPTLLAAGRKLQQAQVAARRSRLVKQLEEARLALGRMQYREVREQLSSPEWQAGEFPDLAKQAAALAEEALQHEQEAARRSRLAKQLEEARLALGRRQYREVRDQLSSPEWQAGEFPDLAKQAAALVEEARQREEEAARRSRLAKQLEEARLALGRTQYREVREQLSSPEWQAGEFPDLTKQAAALAEEALQREQAAARRSRLTQQLEEARLALGRRQYREVREQLTSPEWQAGEFPDLTKQAAALAEEALQREQEAERRSRLVKQLEEARLALGRMQYREVREQLSSPEWRAGEFLDLAKQAAALAEEARQREQEAARRSRVAKQVKEARLALGRGEYKQALEVLKSLPPELTQTPDLDSEVLALQEQARQQEQQSILRQQAAQDAAEQVRKKQFAEAIATLEKAVAAVGTSAEIGNLLQVARDQQRRERARQRDQLLAIEPKVPGAKISKLKVLSDQVQQIAASYSADEEIATLASRIRQRIAAEMSASAAPRRPLPWGRVALGMAVVAVVAAAVKLGPSLFHKPTVPVEIRSYPVGASVRIGDRSCIAPNCKFELPPGQYQIQAQLDGFLPVQQTLTLDAAKPTPLVSLTLQPVPVPVPVKVTGPVTPPPQPPTHPVSAMGTLEVQAGLPNALVYVDNLARGRTDNQGSFSAPLEAKSHQIRVEKTGYQTPREQQVDIAKGASRRLTFKLVPELAKLDLRGAPAGVEIRLGTSLLGRTDGSPSFAVPVPPGDQSLQVVQGPLTRQFAQEFAPGQTRIVDWTNVAPQPPPKPPQPQPRSPEELEAQDWNRVRNAPDATQLEGFLRTYPNGPHAAEARSTLQDLVWKSANRDDVGALQGYLNRFPTGPHSDEASRRLDDILWSKVDQKDPKALSAFIAQHPDSTHRSEAQLLLSQLEKPPEPLKPQPSAADVQAIGVVLGQFNAAFENKQPREVKQVWPTIPGQYIDAMRVPGATFVIALHPTGDAEVNGNAASIPCQLATRTTVPVGQPSQTQKAVTVTLRKVGGRWTIVNPLGTP